MSDLKDFAEKKVRVITTDGRFFEGILQGWDNSTNLILSNCIERIIYPEEDEENQELDLGLYLLRGGNVVCVAEVNESVSIDWSKVKCDLLKSTKNPM